MIKVQDNDVREVKFPTPVSDNTERKVMLDFFDAVRAISVGEKVTRIEWKNASEYCFIHANVLHIHRNNTDHVWQISLGDIEGEDWIVL